MAEELVHPGHVAAIGRHDRQVLMSATQVLALTRARQGPVCTHQEELAQLLLDLTEHSRSARADLAWSATFCGFDDTGEIIRRHVAADAAALRVPFSARLQRLARQALAAVRARRRLSALVRQPWSLLRTFGFSTAPGR